MRLRTSYRLRLRRKRWLLRAALRARDLYQVADKTSELRRDDLLLFANFRNEARRLPWFLDYYRKLGINHFLIVDNGSRDGSTQYLAEQDDVSLWYTEASYRRARFGVDWLNALRRRYGTGHWCLTVDADEQLVYPHHTSRPLRALTEWLDDRGVEALPTLLLDMYPRTPVEKAVNPIGQDPVSAACWFDDGNYVASSNPVYGNLWVQGGPRLRTFFAKDPKAAPALNKIPLVRWQRGHVYASSTHLLLPCRMNRQHLGAPGVLSGCLLHTKFLPGFDERVREEVARCEHYGSAAEYRAYADRAGADLTLWSSVSARYRGWRHLESLGLMSAGAWT